MNLRSKRGFVLIALVVIVGASVGYFVGNYVVPGNYTPFTHRAYVSIFPSSLNLSPNSSQPFTGSVFTNDEEIEPVKDYQYAWILQTNLSHMVPTHWNSSNDNVSTLYSVYYYFNASSPGQYYLFLYVRIGSTISISHASVDVTQAN